MRKNKETIALAKVRRYIRQAIDWSKGGKDECHFYSNENYKYASRITYDESNRDMNYPYYNKSTRAIEEIAKKIYDLVLNSKLEISNKDLEIQCNQTKAFGDKLQLIQKESPRVYYEVKLKKYRDEILELKEKIKNMEKK